MVGTSMTWSRRDQELLLYTPTTAGVTLDDDVTYSYSDDDYYFRKVPEERPKEIRFELPVVKGRMPEVLPMKSQTYICLKRKQFTSFYAVIVSRNRGFSRN